MVPRVVPYQPDHLVPLTRLINSAASKMPPTDAYFSEAAVRQVFESYETLWHHHYDEQPYTPQNVRVAVASADGRPSGVVVYRWDDGRDVGSIGYVLFSESMPSAGDLLVEHAVSGLAEQGCSRVMTWDRNPFGLGWTGVPGVSPHIGAALDRHGFVLDERWVLMVANTQIDPPPVLAYQPPDWQLAWTVDRETSEWRLDIYYREEIVAECQFWGPPPHLAECPGFDGWVTVEWIGVSEEHRRIGLARWLLTRQLAFHHEEGRPNVMLWTGPGNTPARTLYHDLGFIDGPEAHQYRLDL